MKLRIDPALLHISNIYQDKVQRTVKEATKKHINQEALKLITKISDDMRQKIEDVLKDGETKGRSVSATASTLLKTGLDKGVFRSSRVRAYKIARTELHRARQRGAIDIYKAANIKYVVWTGIPEDGRICKFCQALHGKHFHIDNLKELPPLHPQCFVDSHIPIYTIHGWKSLKDIRIGDLVLTHKGQFKRVTHTLKIPKQNVNVVTIITKFPFTKNQTHNENKISVTEEHPLFVNGEWKEAKNIKIGDKIGFLASKCKWCEILIPHFKKFCSHSCQSKWITKNQWIKPEHRKSVSEKNRIANLRQYENGERDRFETTKAANEKMRKMVLDGTFRLSQKGKTYEELFGLEKTKLIKQRITEGLKNSEYHKNGCWQHTKPENEVKLLKEKSSEAIRNHWKEHPEDHPNKKMGRKGKFINVSKPQMEMYRRLKEVYPDAELEYPIKTEVGVRFADVAIPSFKIDCEYDGDYWHKNKECDNCREELIRKSGWDVIRFNKSNVNGCVDSVQRLLQNHSNEYEFIEVPVVDIKYWNGIKTRYNLEVEDDESYIAKGYQSHNCRCRVLPVQFQLKISPKKAGVSKLTISTIPKDYKYVVNIGKLIGKPSKQDELLEGEGFKKAKVIYVPTSAGRKPYWRHDPREKKALDLDEELKKLVHTEDAHELGKKLTYEQAVKVWEKYKQNVGEDAKKNLDTMSKKELQEYGIKSYHNQLMREAIDGYLGATNTSFTREEIEEQLSKLQKAKPYQRVRHGKLEHVKGYARNIVALAEPELTIEKAWDSKRKDVQIANNIVSLVKNEGGRALIVGGFVRDALLGKPSKDIDIEVYGIRPDVLKDLLEKNYPKVDTVGASFGVFKVSDPELSEAIDVSMPRKDSKIGIGHKGFEVYADPNMTVEEAARRRDLTINSLSYDPLTKELIDPYNGLQDIKDKKLRATDPNTFIEDPLRVLRVMQFAARFGMTPDLNLVKICRAMDLSSLPRERIYGEFEKLLLKSHTPSIGLRLIPILGIDKIVPEFKDMYENPEDPKWHPEKNTWVHTLGVVDSAAKLKNVLKTKQDKIIYMLAAMLHDIAKPQTMVQYKDGHIHNIGHAKQGAELAVKFLNRFTDEKVILEGVEKLVKNHLIPDELYNAKAGNPAIRRLARRVDIPTLALLSMADKLGTGRLKPGFEAEKWLLNKYKEMNLSDPKTLDPKVKGRHLIELGVQPGPAMGKILKEIYEGQLEGKFQTTEEGIEYGRELGLIKAIPVKGFTRTRHGRLEIVKPFERKGEILDTPENKSIKWKKKGKYWVNAEPLTLYHGTTESKANLIEKEGLIYGNLSISLEYAIKIAKIRREGEKPVIFRVEAPVGSIYPVFHGPKSIATDSLSLVKPITTVFKIESKTEPNIETAPEGLKDIEQRRKEAKDRIMEWRGKKEGIDEKRLIYTDEQILADGYKWRQWAHEHKDAWNWAMWEEIQKLAKQQGYEYKDTLTREELLNNPLLPDVDKLLGRNLLGDGESTDWRNYAVRGKFWRFLRSEDGKQWAIKTKREVWAHIKLMSDEDIDKIWPGMKSLKNAKTWEEAENTIIDVYRGIPDNYAEEVKEEKLEMYKRQPFISYTLAPGIADKFARGYYYSTDKGEGTGIVVKRTIKFGDILGYVNNDGENEVLVKPPKEPGQLFEERLKHAIPRRNQLNKAEEETVVPKDEIDRFKKLDDPKLRKRVKHSWELDDIEKGDYSSVQVELPPLLSYKVKKLLKLIDPEDIHPEENVDEVHITVRYGLHTEKPKDVEDILGQVDYPIKATIAGVDVFQPKGRDYDVLILRADSPQLTMLNQKLAELPNTTEFRFYQPHVTIVYLKQGTGKKYQNMVTGLEGKEIRFQRIEFSDKDRNKIELEKTEVKENNLKKSFNKVRLVLNRDKAREIIRKLRKSREKLIPYREDGKVIWARTNPSGLILKNVKFKKGDNVLLKGGEIGHITAIGRDGVIARDGKDNKFEILNKNIRIVRRRLEK